MPAVGTLAVLRGSATQTPPDKEDNAADQHQPGQDERNRPTVLFEEFDRLLPVVDGQPSLAEVAKPATAYCPRTRSTPSDGLILRWTLAGSRCS